MGDPRALGAWRPSINKKTKIKKSDQKKLAEEEEDKVKRTAPKSKKKVEEEKKMTAPEKVHAPQVSFGIFEH